LISPTVLTLEYGVDLLSVTQIPRPSLANRFRKPVYVLGRIRRSLVSMNITSPPLIRRATVLPSRPASGSTSLRSGRKLPMVAAGAHYGFPPSRGRPRRGCPESRCRRTC